MRKEIEKKSEYHNVKRWYGNSNAIRASLKAIPYIGSSLDQLIFGNLEELRWKRVEKTLREVADMMKEYRIPKTRVTDENFGNLLEFITPGIGRAINEDKRKRFRDLLLNSTKISSDDSEWEKANLSAKYLNEIDAPGLALLAAMHRLTKYLDEDIYDWLSIEKEGDPSYPDHEAPSLLCIYAGGKRHPKEILQYPWAVIEEWMYRLIDSNLIVLDPESFFPKQIKLTSLGKMICQWAITD